MNGTNIPASCPRNPSKPWRREPEEKTGTWTGGARIRTCGLASGCTSRFGFLGHSQIVTERLEVGNAGHVGCVPWPADWGPRRCLSLISPGRSVRGIPRGEMKGKEMRGFERRWEEFGAGASDLGELLPCRGSHGVPPNSTSLTIPGQVPPVAVAAGPLQGQGELQAVRVEALPEHWPNHRRPVPPRQRLASSRSTRAESRNLVTVGRAFLPVAGAPDGQECPSCKKAVR